MKSTMYTYLDTYFYLLVPLCLMLDVLSFGVLGSALIHTLACLYATTLVYGMCGPMRMTILWAAFLTASLLSWDISLTPMLYLLPLTVVGMQLRTLFYPTVLQAVFLLIVYVACRILVDTHVYTMLPVAWFYIKCTLILNSIIVMFFSLILSRGRLDNRFLA